MKKTLSIFCASIIATSFSFAAHAEQKSQAAEKKSEFCIYNGAAYSIGSEIEQPSGTAKICKLERVSSNFDDPKIPVWVRKGASD